MQRWLPGQIGSFAIKTGRMFVTAFLCVLDLVTNEVRFVNAGHNRPFLKQGDGSFHMLEAKANLVLGMMEDIPYKEQSFYLNPGDSVYLYTDGVTEALNPKQQFLGDAGLEHMLNVHKAEAADAEDLSMRYMMKWMPLRQGNSRRMILQWSM